MSHSKSVSVDEMVHVGNDGWLFLVKGANNVSALYKNKSSFTPEMVESWSELLRMRNEKINALGARYVHLPAPEKLTVLHKYYDGKIENINGSPTIALLSSYKSVPDYAVNPIPYFSQQIDKFPVYWKTDTHWSFWGCYCAYQLLCTKLGVVPNDELVKYPYTPVNMVLDLGSKVEPKVKEEARFYKLNQHSKRVYANELVRFKEKNDLINEGSLHVGSHVVFRNESDGAIKQKVILFGDSFSEYRTVLLTGMLAETFEEVHFIWSASLDYEYIEKVRPDYVISELAERFMTRVPEDQMRIDEFAKARVAEYKSRTAM